MAELPPKDERDLLARLGVVVAGDEPSAFDLLGVPESCEDDQCIRDRNKERQKPLKLWEQYRADPKVQKLAIAVKLQLAGAEQKIRNAEVRAKYRKQLAAERAQRFRERVRSVLAPGEELTDARLRQLEELGRSFHLDEAAARQVVAQVSRGDNPFAALGLKPAAQDEAWPTAFDLLNLDERPQAPPPGAVATQTAEQLERIEWARRKGDLDEDGAARLRLYVREAATTLSGAELCEAYWRSLQQQRYGRFVSVLRIALPRGEQADTSTLIRVVHQGRQMRLQQEAIERALKEVSGIDLGSAGVNAPALAVSRSDIQTYVRGNGMGCTETLCIRNEGTGVLQVTLETSDGWIQPAEFRFEVTTRKDVTLTFPPSRLSPGLWSEGVLTIRSNGGETELPVRVMLGPSSTRETLGDDYDQAGVFYRWVPLGTVLLMSSLVVLPWHFMLNRKTSTFLAFHAMQALLLNFCAFLLFASGGVWQAITRSAEPPMGPMLFGMFLLFGPPLLVRKFVKEGRHVQVPLLAPLVKRLL